MLSQRFETQEGLSSPEAPTQQRRPLQPASPPYARARVRRQTSSRDECARAPYARCRDAGVNRGCQDGKNSDTVLGNKRSRQFQELKHAGCDTTGNPAGSEPNVAQIAHLNAHNASGTNERLEACFVLILSCVSYNHRGIQASEVLRKQHQTYSRRPICLTPQAVCITWTLHTSSQPQHPHRDLGPIGCRKPGLRWRQWVGICPSYALISRSRL